MARRKPRRYHIGDAEGIITASQLRRQSRESQKQVMDDWFRTHFQDPVDCCPYDSGEGGYQYIRGGPYDPHEVLNGEFEDIVPAAVIKELADELWNESNEWEGRDQDNGEKELHLSDYSKYFFDSLALSTGHLAEFERSIQDIRKTLNASADDADAQFLHRLLYANVVTALESYLADFFGSAMTEHDQIRRKFVETNPDFQKEKICVGEIYKAWEGLQEKLKQYLADIAWHNLARLKPMFKTALEIEFPQDLDALFKGILVRHDLVHRNGKKKDGSEHSIKRADIEALIHKADLLVRNIEDQWKDLKPAGVPIGAP